MKAFSFHIDPTANFGGPRRRIRRRLLGQALRSQPPIPKAKALPSQERNPRPRKPPPKFLNSDKEILVARQTRYRSFAIATMQRNDGSWTASFCRADGGALMVNGKKQAVMITASYRAESLALAEAQFRIDMRGE